MAKTYKFLNDSGSFDVELLTDAVSDNEKFFITEVRGLNSSEIEAGFQFDIEMVTEADLVDFAATKDLILKKITYGGTGATSANLNDTANFLTFSLAEQSGAATIDAENKTIDIEVEAETVVTALVATFTVSEGCTVKIGVTSQVSGVTANNFTSPKSYIVTSPLGLAVTWTVTVTVAV